MNVTGTTTYVPEEDAVQSGMLARQYLLNKICVGFGARVAEVILNGEENVTSGTMNDLEKCSQTAKMMV